MRSYLNKWSGRRDSNPRQPAWKAGTLATELRPLRFIVILVVPQVGFEPTRPKAEDFESTKSTSSITAAYANILNINRRWDFTDYVLKHRLVGLKS